MADQSRIAQIIDQSAATAASVSGVVAIWGVGSGLVVDPILTAAQGSTVYVRAGLPAVVTAGTHVSDLPPAPRITYRGQSAAELEWAIPMRVYLAPNDEQTARRLAAAFYAPYIAAFAAHTTLTGTVNSALITAWRLFRDSGWTKTGVEWFGLEMTLTAIERLNLDLQP
jgi:hypothetical protein